MMMFPILGWTWVSIPLIYTQLVTIAVYTYFFITLFGRQYLQPTMYKIDSYGKYDKVGYNMTTPGVVNVVGYDQTIYNFYFPLFTFLQYIIYFGWLNVAKILINPFGDDDEVRDGNKIFRFKQKKVKGVLKMLKC